MGMPPTVDDFPLPAPSADLHRFTVDEFERMGEAGIFHEDARLELLEGQVVEMTPIGELHAATVDRLNYLFGRHAADRAIVRVQNPIVTGRYGRPQPDLCLLVPRTDFYRDAHPSVGDVLLVIEVADTSVAKDRELKMPANARAGIPEAWLVNLPASTVEVYREPKDGRYTDLRTARRGESLSPTAFPDITLEVGEILG